jgi:hypothetical protein
VPLHDNFNNPTPANVTPPIGVQIRDTPFLAIAAMLPFASIIGRPAHAARHAQLSAPAAWHVTMAAGYKTSSAFDLGGLWGDSDGEGAGDECFVNASNDTVVQLAGDSVRVRETSFHPQ